MRACDVDIFEFTSSAEGVFIHVDGVYLESQVSLVSRPLLLGWLTQWDGGFVGRVFLLFDVDVGADFVVGIACGMVELDGVHAHHDVGYAMTIGVRETSTVVPR